MCPKHYSQLRYGSKPVVVDVSPMPKCVVSHCVLDANSRQEGAFCDPHYQLRFRGFDPHTRILRKPGSGRNVSEAKCWVVDCPRQARGWGLCASHRSRAKQGLFEFPDSLGVVLNPMCSFVGCVNRMESVKKGLCHSHVCQQVDGRPLSPLRGYGAYVSGSELCAITGCKIPAVSRRLCGGHDASYTKYDLTVHELDVLMQVRECQNVGCSETKRLNIDHCHATGTVRGILCSGCNTTLGRMRDDPEKIRGLLTYLESSL